MNEEDDGGLLLARIVIERRLMPDGSDQVLAEFEDPDGDVPPLVELLGMLAMTTDTAMRISMGDEGDE